MQNKKLCSSLFLCVVLLSTGANVLAFDLFGNSGDTDECAGGPCLALQNYEKALDLMGDGDWKGADEAAVAARSTSSTDTEGLTFVTECEVLDSNSSRYAPRIIKTRCQKSNEYKPNELIEKIRRAHMPTSSLIIAVNNQSGSLWDNKNSKKSINSLITMSITLQNNGESRIEDAKVSVKSNTFDKDMIFSSVLPGSQKEKIIVVPSIGNTLQISLRDRYGFGIQEFSVKLK
jgi:hypothetical protein